MRISEKQRKFSRLLGHFLGWIYLQGYEVTMGEVWRTKEQQDRYVKSGKSKTMQSQHLNRLAVDLNLFIDGELTWDVECYRILGEYWESLDPDCKWGGHFRGFCDAVHFEYR